MSLPDLILNLPGGRQITATSEPEARGPQSYSIPQESVIYTAPQREKTGIEGILDRREARYGGFRNNTRVAAAMKQLAEGGSSWKELAPFQQEALHHILSKISRIVCGDPLYKDNWSDIAGYATLVEKELAS